jgi:alkylation response protein AidB-like acyl-CoA dehydrogenase
MSEYSAPVRDMRFVLEHLAHLDDVASIDEWSHASVDDFAAVLEESGKFMAEVVAPTNAESDRIGAKWVDGEVVTPPFFADMWRKTCEAGWNSVGAPAEYGGGGMPTVALTPLSEMLAAANASFSMLPGLTTGAVEMLDAWADDEQKNTYLPKMISGEWSGTMNLTEPEAGSDVGALRTAAVKQDDGSYLISGTKIYISFGEHDLTENIIHLVLARTPDAPPGTKGISCFIVPKFLVNEDGSLGERNDVTCVSIEHKLGITSSPTCVLSFGENGGAVGYLIGEENRGMKYMFTMMNNARLAVGIAGVGIADRAYQHAVQWAQDRVQGRPIGAAADVNVPIIEHADVRRMLLTMRSQVEASRALSYLNGAAIDLGRRHPDEAERERWQHLAELLTPVTKAWSTDVGVEVCSTAIQVFGGMGFIEETGIAQNWRDERIQPIYEGTNGIQALDLIGRKLPLGGGAPINALLTQVKELADEVEALGDGWALSAANLRDATAAWEKATWWIFEHGVQDPVDAAAGATPYLKLFGTVFGGYLLARSAVVAAKLLAGDGYDDPRFLEDKQTTARFYCEQLLPQAGGLVGAVTAGKQSLFGIPADRF